MKFVALLALAAASGIAALALAGDAPSPASPPGASQIVEQNVAARGGLEAWRKIQTMAWIGHIESAQASVPRMPFVLEMKRPNKTRFEIKAQNQFFLRTYDGAQGWKLRPGRNGYPEVLPYTAAELSYARDGQGIDGPLIDYPAKGIAVRLDGSDEIEGRKAYRLNVTLPSGASNRVWIDAQSFLEVKSDRMAGNALSMAGKVAVFYRDYRSLDGLQIPFLVESGSETAENRDRMVIDLILLNPPLDDDLFAKPKVPRQQRGMVSAARGPAQAANPSAAP